MIRPSHATFPCGGPRRAALLGNVADILPTLTGDLQAVVDLIESLIGLVQPLAGTAITTLGPSSVSLHHLITPVVSSSLLDMGLTGTLSLP